MPPPKTSFQPFTHQSHPYSTIFSEPVLTALQYPITDGRHLTCPVRLVQRIWPLVVELVMLQGSVVLS